MEKFLSRVTRQACATENIRRFFRLFRFNRLAFRFRSAKATLPNELEYLRPIGVRVYFKERSMQSCFNFALLPCNYVGLFTVSRYNRYNRFSLKRGRRKSLETRFLG